MCDGLAAFGCEEPFGAGNTGLLVSRRCGLPHAPGHINQTLRLSIHTGPSATGARTHTPMHIGCECASPSCAAHCHNMGPEMGVAAAQIIVDTPVSKNAPSTSGCQRPGRVKCVVEGVAETESALVAPNCLRTPSQPLGCDQV